MSYIRWNTPLNPNLGFDDIMFLLQNGVGYAKCAQINARGSQLSKWYIFWNVCSGKTKEDQILSCWLACSSNLGYIDYEQAIYMLETYDVSPLNYGDEITQINVLFDCIQQWVEDVNNDFEEDSNG